MNEPDLKSRLMPVDYLFLCHVIVLVILQIAWAMMKYVTPYLYINISLLIIVPLFIYLYIKHPKSKVIIFLRFFYAPLFVVILYKNMEPILTLLTSSQYDWLLDAVDRAICFGYSPVLIMQSLTNPILTEIMHIGYLLYYLFIPVVAFTLFFRDEEEFARYLFAIMSMYAVSFLTFIILPATSPRFFYPAHIIPVQPGMVFKFLNDYVMDKQALVGGSFPSSHVGLAVASSMFYYRYNKTYGLVAFFFTFLLSISTIYGRYHYLIDVLIGVFLGIFFTYISLRFMPRKTYRIR